MTLFFSISSALKVGNACDFRGKSARHYTVRLAVKPFPTALHSRSPWPRFQSWAFPFRYSCFFFDTFDGWGTLERNSGRVLFRVFQYMHHGFPRTVWQRTSWNLGSINESRRLSGPEFIGGGNERLRFLKYSERDRVSKYQVGEEGKLLKAINSCVKANEGWQIATSALHTFCWDD